MVCAQLWSCRCGQLCSCSNRKAAPMLSKKKWSHELTHPFCSFLLLFALVSLQCWFSFMVGQRPGCPKKFKVVTWPTPYLFAWKIWAPCSLVLAFAMYVLISPVEISKHSHLLVPRSARSFACSQFFQRWYAPNCGK